MGLTNGTVKDAFGKVAGKTGTIDDALAAAQQATLAELKNRGLKVAQ